MTGVHWKEVLAQRFHKAILPPEKGRHAYRLTQAITIRVDGKDVSVQAGALFTFPQDDLAVIAENERSPAKYNIALSAISAVKFD
jgi:hypothetical protein